MLLLTLSCLASLTSSVQADFVSQHSQHRRAAEYSHVGCGLRPSYESFQKTGKRIGTGTDVKPGEFPWLVSIQSQGKHICGGTIISALWILTAAHCFADELPPDLTVAVGGLDLSLPLEEHNPDSLILHEEFNRTSLQNDIALILLSNPVEFSTEKIPICLPFVCDMGTWQHCWAAGWDNTSAASPVLQKTRMKLISREECLKQIPHLVVGMMCAETEQGEGEGGEGGGGGGGEGGGGGGCQLERSIPASRSPDSAPYPPVGGSQRLPLAARIMPSPVPALRGIRSEIPGNRIVCGCSFMPGCHRQGRPQRAAPGSPLWFSREFLAEMGSGTLF
ncbi:serine protease 55-like isoform X2 [Vidua chalybeata]|uniref:serine protease 55-like isoform X2 n=1 Tax=Vidua chalybeata TaxID=81927 RepID=UPI0023A8BAB3|nr:serine protease 55-like isoform X2 [Vidua chalybeata]